MKARSILPLLVLLGISFSLAWHLFRGDAGSDHERTGSEAPEVRTERRGDVWRAVDTRSGVMGSRFSVEVAAPGEDSARRACTAAYSAIHDIESRLSTWRPESTLSRLNDSAYRQPCFVDRDTFAVIRLARSIHDLTGGAFDPTVGPIVGLWRNAPSKREAPSRRLVSGMLERIGMTHVTLDPDRLAVSFKIPDVALDLGGIAKGYAADAAARAAIAEGALACRVNAGGDHMALGTPPWEPAGFRVAVRDPLGGETDTLDGVGFFLPSGQAVATSGNYERFSEIGGHRYSHIIDPKTGWPVENPVVQVTVVATGGARADALATAFSVMGVDRSMALARGLPDVQALFVVRRGGKLARIATKGFPEGPR